MSYDLQVYTSRKMDNSSRLKLIEKFKLNRHGKSLVIQGKNWQILISESTYKVHEEDFPEMVFNKVPGLSYGLNIILEPIGAPKIAYGKLNSIARNIAKELMGVVHDEQLGEIILPNKSRAISLDQTVDKRIDLLTLTWWFDNNFLEKKDNYNELLKTLEKYCPEFLPKRYGYFEPPEYKTEEKGIEHFISFIFENRKDSTIIKPQKPFYSVSLPRIKESYYNRNGFCPKKLELQVDARLLQIEEWELTLKRLWYQLNNLIKPIYSDVCIIEGYIDNRNSLGVDEKTGCHQIHIDWKGIPEVNGIAAFIGEPYKSITGLSNSVYSADSWAKKTLIKIPNISNKLNQKRIRIKPDFQDFAFNRFKTFHAESFPFNKPSNYEVHKSSGILFKFKNR